MSKTPKRSIVLKSLLLISLVFGGVLATPLMAQDEESSAATRIVSPAVSPDFNRGVASIEGQLFVGTSQNSNDPTDTLNDVFAVNPSTDSSTSILSEVQVWGATADLANQRVLFTTSSGLAPPPGSIGGGDELVEIPVAGGAPNSLGVIALATGAPLRIDGLAISGGTLYGVNAGGGAENGFYSIDLGTLVATQIAPFMTESISGLDADPDTGIIYGTDDSTGQLVSIDTSGVITNVAAYPAGIADIDGLAVGNGLAFLVTDESQPISVYDLTSGTYLSDLTSPFTSADVFSGAAFPAAPSLPESVPVPTFSTWGLLMLMLVLGLFGIWMIRK